MISVRLVDLPVWGVQPVKGAPVFQERGDIWYPLSAIPGAEVRLSTADSRLDLTVPRAALLAVPGLPPLTAGGAALPAPAEAGAVRPMPMDVLVNGNKAGNWVLLEHGGKLYAPEDAFTEWRLKRSPAAIPFDYRGQRWYSLTDIPGFRAQVDPANQSIDLRFSAQEFASTRVERDTRTSKTPKVSPSIPAAWINYDLNAEFDSARGEPASRAFGGIFETGVSNDWGVLTSNFVGTNVLFSTDPAGSQWRRLETTYTRDFPAQDLTLHIGDATTRAVNGGRQVYFGGIQIGRNFGLTPNFVTQPIPVIAGVSSAPSTVDLYINDALRQTSRVPPGPFSIDNVPLVSGTGQARVVVRDLLGRETVLVQDFYTSGSLLAPGLTDWSVEAGAVRRNLGEENADYAEHFVSGLYRRGITPDTTAQANGEFGQQTRALGLSLTTTLWEQLLAEAGLARSQNTTIGSGWQAFVGVERRNIKQSFSARIEAGTRNFRELGFTELEAPPRVTASLNYNYTTQTLGNFGFAFARTLSDLVGGVNSFTISYATRLLKDSSLAVSLTRTTGFSSGTAVNMSLVIPLDRKITTSSQVTVRGGQMDAYTSAVLPLTQETGYGGRLAAGVRSREAYSEGGIYYQGSRGLATADLSVSPSQQSMRFGASGGIAVADGRFFTARRVEDSFALVEVPGYPNVGIGFQGSTLTRTDADGVAILPRLVPYTANSIQLNPRELPISAELDSIEQIVVPPARSAVKVVFPVRTGRGALVKLVLDDGEPAPAGAQVELVGDKEEFFVARHGDAFITGMKDRNVIRVKYNGQACNVEVVLPPASPDDIPRVGPLTCSGVKR
ncbi:MAG TPA: fimbria/pilus outer membrane usher protein [Ramlibacter sp.]